MDLRPFITDPANFQRDIHVPTAAGPRRFGDVMADFQRERFAALNPALSAVASGNEPLTRRFWVEATKGASKDSDLAVCLLWLLAFAPRSLRIQIGAYDADQADELRLIIKQMLRIDAPLNRAVASLVEVQADSIVNHRTGSAAEILTTDSKGTHGSRPDVVLLNELSHVGDREFAETLLDNADKVPTGIVIIATNAGWTDSWQAEWQATALASSRWYVHRYQQPAPWIAQADLDESERRNPPARFRRLWRGEWVAGEGDAIEGALIDQAFCLSGPHEAPKPGFVYVLACDLSITRDSSAAALVGIDIGHWREITKKSKPRSRVIEALADLYPDDYQQPDDEPEGEFVGGSRHIELARLVTWTPSPGRRVPLTDVESVLADLARTFNVVRILADNYQAELLVQRLQQSGLPALGVQITQSTNRAIAAATLSSFQERRLRLFPHEQLQREVRSLRIREKPNDVVVLESPRVNGSHGDCASALGLGLMSIRNLEHAPPVAVRGELVCWP